MNDMPVIAENAPKNKIETAASKTATIRPHLWPMREKDISVTRMAFFSWLIDTPWERRIEHSIIHRGEEDGEHK